MLNEIDLRKFNNTVELFKTKNFSVVTEVSTLDTFTSRTKLLCKCEEGHLFTKTRNNFMKNAGCPKCANTYGRGNKAKLSYSNVKKVIESSGEYILESESYINGKEKLSIRHNNCGETFLMRYNDFQQGYRCPSCFNSRGKVFSESLNFINYDFITELILPEIKNNRVLSFDLCIDNFIFEYDGAQHFSLHKSRWCTSEIQCEGER
jgi:hypothetical protein